ncbi:hypothetical protein [Alicyclobacillus mengziensis]|uniref:Uncharacterized protein n=1 Tax=Alicyclobacillus mengziensis TaxID=2931921 RepID=A0A9X7W0B6_9BACL|nr:hypothetical protein [Alicyclobacillus mengziensis]QSO48341.1 hypothetical protein JZ786_04965 [Alicyclobacillus mengziensis]
MEKTTAYMVAVYVEWNPMQIPIGFIGLDPLEGLRELHGEYMDEPKFYLVPESVRAELEAFRDKVRKDLFDSSAKTPVGFAEEYEDIRLYADEDGKLVPDDPTFYMTEQILDEFRQRFEKYEKAFYQLRDKVVSQYEGMKEDFISLVVEATSRQAEMDTLRKQLENLVPSQEKFKASFEISMDTMKHVLYFDTESHQRVLKQLFPSEFSVK